MTIREIQRAREKLAREIARLEAAAETLRLQDIQLAAMEDELRRRLHQHEPERTIVRTDMELNTEGQPRSVRIGAARATRNHPAMRKFYKAGKTIGDIAKELGEGRPRVSSWMLEENPRPIPAKHRKYLFEKYGVPESAWKNRAE